MSNFAPKQTVPRKQGAGAPTQLMGWRAKEQYAREEEEKVRLRRKMQEENQQRDDHYRSQGKLYAENALEMIDIINETIQGNDWPLFLASFSAFVGLRRVRASPNGSLLHLFSIALLPCISRDPSLPSPRQRYWRARPGVRPSRRAA